MAQKYGYRPFPPKILAGEFEKILNAVKEEDDKRLLQDWFVRDDNTVPAKYLLQPIREKLVHYVDDANPDKKKEVKYNQQPAYVFVVYM